MEQSFIEWMTEPSESEKRFNKFLQSRSSVMREEAKQKNIIDMALKFASMSRVFEANSKEKIEKELNNCLEDFYSITSEDEYKQKHTTFCKWFVKNIKKAKSKGKSRRVSYGQAAKVLDVVLKVCFYYCHLPTEEVANNIYPILNCPIDSLLLGFLKCEYNKDFNRHYIGSTISGINKKQYDLLQSLIRSVINLNGTCPVEFDDRTHFELKRIKKKYNSRSA